MPYSRSVLATDNFTLQCQTTGVPSPVIKWIKNEQLLIQNDATIIYNATSDSTTNSTLTVVNVTIEDAGQYICEASNEVGSSTIRFDVDVSGINNIITSY